jgi:hypothetical protein
MPALRSLDQGAVDVLCRKHLITTLSPERAKDNSPGQASEASAALGCDPNNLYFFSIRSPEKRMMKKLRTTTQRCFLQSMPNVRCFFQE